MLALSALVRCRAGATAVVSVHALVSTAAHAMAQTDLAIGGSGAEWRRGCFAARSEPERRKGDTALGRGMRTTEVGDDSRAAWQHRNGAPVAHDARDLILSWRSSQCSRHGVIVCGPVGVKEADNQREQNASKHQCGRHPQGSR